MIQLINMYVYEAISDRGRSVYCMWSLKDVCDLYCAYVEVKKEIL